MNANKGASKDEDEGVNAGANAAADKGRKANPQAAPALPNERDTKPEPDAPRPREKIRQASEDLKQGQVDTDQHGERGIDQAVNPENVIETPKSTHDVGGKRS